PPFRERFCSAVLDDALRSYGIVRRDIRPLHAFQNFVYEFRRGAREFILRISHSSRRREAMILGELDWIEYLGAHGALIATPVPAEDGRLLQAIPDGRDGSFLATAFVKAQGHPPWRLGWTRRFYEQ